MKKEPTPEQITRLQDAIEGECHGLAIDDLIEIAKRLIKWDTDFPVNCWNGYAGLKELDRIIADAKAAVTKANGACFDELGAPVPEIKNAGQSPPFQARVGEWMHACFGDAIAYDKAERTFRFLEEALELAQACGATAGEARKLVDYVFGRPAGEPFQEAGGVQVTLAALCTPHEIDITQAAETELARVWTKVAQIRAKHDSKPQGIRSALPGGAA